MALFITRSYEELMRKIFFGRWSLSNVIRKITARSYQLSAITLCKQLPASNSAIASEAKASNFLITQHLALTVYPNADNLSPKTTFSVSQTLEVEV